MRSLLFALLAAASTTDEVTERWPDGGPPRTVQTWAATDGGRVLLRERIYFTNGALWSQTSWSEDGGSRTEYDPEGWVKSVTSLTGGRANGLAKT